MNNDTATKAATQLMERIEQLEKENAALKENIANRKKATFCEHCDTLAICHNVDGKELCGACINSCLDRTNAAEQLALQRDDQVRDLMSANDELMCENQCSHDEADEIGMLLPEPPDGDCSPVNMARNAAKIIEAAVAKLGKVEEKLETLKMAIVYALNEPEEMMTRYAAGEDNQKDGG